MSGKEKQLILKCPALFCLIFYEKHFSLAVNLANLLCSTENIKSKSTYSGHCFSCMFSFQAGQHSAARSAHVFATPLAFAAHRRWLICFVFLQACVRVEDGVWMEDFTHNLIIMSGFATVPCGQ